MRFVVSIDIPKLRKNNCSSMNKPKKKKKPPAPWARKSPLKKALKVQFGVTGNIPLNPELPAPVTFAVLIILLIST